jgi:ACS family tartrate transporter-like MFS transporter
MDVMDLVGKRTMSKIKWHIMPFVFLLYMLNIIDRMDLGYAALEMNKALHISGEAFGILSSVFFISYFFFEVPSNMALHRFGARKWMARIMISWGVVTCLMFFVQGLTHIAILRFLLGAAEAGFFPGMLYYFTFWFPSEQRAWAVSVFMLAIPFSMIIAGPISTWILDNINWFNASGWRWVFMFEGIPAAILGLATLFFLTDKPQEAKWLDKEEKEWLQSELAKEAKPKEASRHLSLKGMLAHPRVWRLALIYMTMQITAQTAAMWTPLLMKEFSKSFSNMSVGWLTMGMNIVAAVGMVLWSWHSDIKSERKYHAAIPMVLSAIGLLMTAFSHNLIVKLIGLTINFAGNVMYTGPFWSLPAIFLTSEAAAVGMAVINSMSSFGGFVGSNVVGFLKDSSLGASGIFAFQALCCLVAFVMVITLRKKDVVIEKVQETVVVSPSKA